MYLVDFVNKSLTFKNTQVAQTSRSSFWRQKACLEKRPQLEMSILEDEKIQM